MIITIQTVVGDSNSQIAAVFQGVANALENLPISSTGTTTTTTGATNPDGSPAPGSVPSGGVP